MIWKDWAWRISDLLASVVPLHWILYPDRWNRGTQHISDFSKQLVRSGKTTRFGEGWKISTEVYDGR
jgi:hypothetical protein